jgi:hypothetical protein
MPSRYFARTLHRVAASHRHNEAVAAWSKRVWELPNGEPVILREKQANLQAQFVALAQAVSLCGTDGVGRKAHHPR